MCIFEDGIFFEEMMKVIFSFVLLLFGLNGMAGDLRVDISRLENRNDTMYFGSQLFTGVAVLTGANGNIVLETTYKNGLPNGLETAYYPDGNKRSESMMKDGKYNGKVIHYYPNGKIESSETYKNDFKYGYAVYYYENGQKKKEGMYYDCKEVGLWMEYWPNGVKKAEGKYNEAQKTGVWNYWDESGKLVKTIDYDKSANPVVPFGL